MLLGGVAEGIPVQHGPAEADHAQHNEGLTPSGDGDDANHQRWRHSTAQTRERVGYALSKTALRDRYPVGEGTRGGWKSAALAQSKRQAQYQQRHQRSDKARQQCGDTPDQRQHHKNLVRSEPVCQPTAHNLHACIGIGKGREHQTKLQIAEPHFLLEHGRGDRHIDSVDIGNEIHQAHDAQNHVMGFDSTLHVCLLGTCPGRQPGWLLLASR